MVQTLSSSPQTFTTPLSVDIDSNVFLAYSTETQITTHRWGWGGVGCTEGWSVQAGEGALSLLTIAADGTSSTKTLKTYNYSQAASQGNIQYAGFYPHPTDVIPDGQSGALALWVQAFQNGSSFPYTVTHASPTAQLDYPLPTLSAALEPGSNYMDVHRMVLGENGTAFATDTQNVASFDINSGQTNWTAHPSSSTIGAMYGMSGAGVTLLNAAANLIPPDAQGSAGAGLSGVNFASPWSLNRWASSYSGTSLIAGPSTDLVFSAFSATAGSRYKTSASPIPVIANFEPVDPDPPNLMAADFKQRYNDQTAGTGFRKTYSYFRVDDRTWEVFKDRIQRPLDAVSFIGHSLFSTLPGSNHAVGLCFGSGMY